MVAKIILFIFLLSGLGCHTSKKNTSNENKAAESTASVSTNSQSSTASSSASEADSEKPQTTDVKKQSDDQSIYFEMEKTPCFGRCPVYILKIYANGNAVLTGKQNLDKIGDYKKNIGGEKVKELVSAFEAAGFFKMEDQYLSKATDLPTTWVTFRNNGKSKKIRDYHNAPQELKELEQMLHELTEQDGWEKLDSQPTEQR